MLKRTVYIPWHQPEYVYKADVGTPARHTVDQIEINVLRSRAVKFTAPRTDRSGI
jgi:hypothetical protein